MLLCCTVTCGALPNQRSGGESGERRSPQILSAALLDVAETLRTEVATRFGRVRGSAACPSEARRSSPLGRARPGCDAMGPRRGRQGER